ncbi:MAG: hypothetical protein LBC92_04295, partial [Rickettsiales bacterium]|nr:hypothetical protein [Rickettsiales bacterium]
MNELEQRKQDIVMLNELFDRFDKGTINDEYLSKLEYNGDRFKPFIFDVLYSIVNGENKEIDPRLCERYERLKNDNLIFKNLDLNKYGSLLYKSVIDIIGRGRLMLSIDIFMKLKSISKDAKFDFLLTGAEQYFLKYCGNFIDHVDRLYRQDGVEYSLNKIVEMINEFDFQFDDDGILQYYPIYNKTVEYTEQNQIDLQDFVNRYVNTNGKNGKFVKLINKFAPIFEKCKSYVKTNKEIYDVDSVSYLSYGIQGVIFKINKKNGEADVIKVICDKNCYEVDKSFFDLQKSNEKLFKDGGIIPYTYISGIEDEKYIVVTPYIEGGELKKEHLFEENKQILTNILNQFMYFHKNNIMHRDFKPLNVIDGNLIDFGSYYDYNKSENHPLEYNIESFEALVGTHGFSSPSLLRYFELDNNSSPLAESCALENKNAFSEDVWSLGVTIFYLLCNTRMIINFYKRPLGLYNQQEIFNFIDGLNIEDESRGELLNKYKEL